MTAQIIQFPKTDEHATTFDDMSVFDHDYECTQCGHIGKMLSIFGDAQFCTADCYFKFVGD